MSRYVLAIDIGGTKTAAAIVAADGTLRHTCRLPTPAAEGAAAILVTVITAGRELLAAAQDEHLSIVAVGVGSAGNVDHTRGVVTYASGTLSGWTGTALADELGAAFGLPVAVDNDVNAMALGEHRCGAGRSLTHALYLTVGTGVGGAIIHDGRLWRGATWSAGEIGHLLIDWNGARRCSCGHTGHLEAYTAGPAIAERYRMLHKLGDSCDLRRVAEHARAGDSIARQVIAEGASILGLALGGLLNTLDPQAVIVGGGVAELGELWWPSLEAALRANPLPGPARIPLRPAQLGVNAVLVGAAALAWDVAATQAERS